MKLSFLLEILSEPGQINFKQSAAAAFVHWAIFYVLLKGDQMPDTVQQLERSCSTKHLPFQSESAHSEL
jgi:hypothetical protein